MFKLLTLMTVGLVQGNVPTRESLEQIAFETIGAHPNLAGLLSPNSDCVFAIGIMAGCDWDSDWKVSEARFQATYGAPFGDLFESIADAVFDEKSLTITKEIDKEFRIFRNRLQHVAEWGLFHSKEPSQMNHWFHEIGFKMYSVSPLLNRLAMEMRNTAIKAYSAFAEQYGEHYFEDLKPAVGRFLDIAGQSSGEDASALLAEVLRLTDKYPKFKEVMTPTIRSLEAQSAPPAKRGFWGLFEKKPQEPVPVGVEEEQEFVPRAELVNNPNSVIGVPRTYVGTPEAEVFLEDGDAVVVKAHRMKLPPFVDRFFKHADLE
jgi:hypothetical protein